MSKYKHVKCYRCQGTGREKIDYVEGVFSLGLTVLEQLSNPSPCAVCDGEGFITKKVKNDND